MEVRNMKSNMEFDNIFASDGYAPGNGNIDLNKQNHQTITHFFMIVEYVHGDEPFNEDKKLSQLILILKNHLN